MTARTLADCVMAARPRGRDRGRGWARRAVRFAAIAAAIAGAGLAVAGAWGGEPRELTDPLPLPPARAEPGEYRWPIVKVIDGDTLKVDARADMPPELARLNVRLRGVDTPEKGGRAKCDAERRAGRAATAFTAAAVANAATVTFRNLAWGKYGGRVLADATVDGRSLADSLIIAGHGRAGMVVTSGDFGEDAVAEARRYAEDKGIPIELVNGKQLARLIVEHGLKVMS